ncbi:MAG TPA: hypothetical protein VGJ95_07945 [Pseudonocardiaceae bacterium]|jgi:hypothetical protein
MRRAILRAIVALGALFFVGVLSVPSASATSPHFKKGGEPTCTITSTSAPSASTSCTATLAGLGNADVRVVLTVSGSAVYQCQNGGGNLAVGQNKVLVGPAVTPVIFPASAIKNGNLSFTVANTLTAPATVSGADAGCPNPNWTGVRPVLKITDISLVIEQPVGTVIFTCTASDQDGLTSPVALAC